MKFLKYKFINSPVGMLKIVIENEALVAILWDNERPNRVRLNTMEEDEIDPLLLEIENQLSEFFNLQRKDFNLPMKTEGTLFQQAVWEALTQIPYGSTIAYKDVAQHIGRPEAVRAVGAAIGRNPISIVIPCHRVLASNGRLTGFAGGLNRKRTLLDLESK